MRIGFFTSVVGWGGSEICLQTLLRGVRELGHEPVLFGIEGTRLLREIRNEGIECVAWKSLETPGPVEPLPSDAEPPARRGARSLKARVLAHTPDSIRLLVGNAREVMALRKVFRRHPVDVMHVSLSGYEMAGLACQWVGIPSLGWHALMPCSNPGTIRRWLIRWSGQCYTCLGGTSKACADAWHRQCGLPAERCIWVWNGIDTLRFGSSVPLVRGPGDPCVILAAGRLQPMKGFDGLIRAFGLLDDARAELWIAGDGPEEGALRELASRTPRGNSVMFLGHSENPERLYASAHVFVLPSVSLESFGLVVAEAMAAGLPVITSDFGPLPEINLAGETGLVVPTRNAGALAEALLYVMDHPEQGRNWGAAGRKRAMEVFTQERMVAEMLRIYEGLARPATKRSRSPR